MMMLDHPSGGSRRIFWAVPLDETVRSLVASACRDMKKTMSFRNWTHPEDYHITLIFLGETADKDIPAIIRAAQDVAARHAPFCLCLSGPGTFGGGGGKGGSGARGPSQFPAPRVLWFGVEGDRNRLARLQKDLSDAHEPLGYKPERRPYSPHITVARKGDHPLPNPLPNPLNLLRGQPNPEADPAAKCSPAPASKPSPEPCWEVRRIVLYETRMGHSPMYKELAVLPLGSG